MDAVRQHPEIVVSQFAYLFAVTKETVQKFLTSKRPQRQFRSTNNSLDWKYLPQVGMGVGLSLPLGSSPLSANISASYDLDPLIANIMRAASGMKTPEEVKQSIQSISMMNPTIIAALGGLTWDAWNNTGQFQQLHSMYGIVSQYTSSVPRPDAPPSDYIDMSSPFVAPFFTKFARRVAIRILFARIGDAFLKALPKKALTKTDSILEPLRFEGPLKICDVILEKSAFCSGRVRQGIGGRILLSRPATRRKNAKVLADKSGSCISPA